MRSAIWFLSFAVALSLASPAASQSREEQSPPAPKPPTAKEVAEKVEQAQNIKTKIDEAQSNSNPRFVRALTNVQIEVTLTDQAGAGAADKKTVSMIASSGNWGKIRSAATVIVIGEPPYAVDLNVDARPFVTVDGQIQLEMTLVYAPVKAAGDPKEGPKQRPSGINQSQTVVLQSGKSLMVSQAADPLSNRKVTVEVKATILK
jgi:hypothetical protein